jgi:hypothetical protein
MLPTIEMVPPGPAPELVLPEEPFPADYLELMAAWGPGTLAGRLRLVAPGTEQDEHPLPAEGARLWGVFDSGETCWWLPIDDDPANWLIVLSGRGRQQLNLSTTEFLDQWLDGTLDLPTLSLGPVARERTLTRAGHEPADPGAEPEVARDPLAQLGTIEGPTESHRYDWPEVEREIGVARLPADYRRLAETYGPFAFNGIFVAEPIALAGLHQMHVGLIEEDENGQPRAVHPQPGGLLYCGSTEGRAGLYWDTGDPDPDRWPIVCDTGSEPETFAGTLTELLVAQATGTSDIDLAAFELGDPREWAWPYWGPKAPADRIG